MTNYSSRARRRPVVIDYGALVCWPCSVSIYLSLFVP